MSGLKPNHCGVAMRSLGMSELEDPKTAYPKPPYSGKYEEPPGSEDQLKPCADHGEESYIGHGLLEGRRALITGADSGIGRAVALAFAREGADVAISYLSEHDDAATTGRVVEQAGRRALTLPGDLADEAHCRALIEQTVAGLGKLDIVVVNAAYQ